MAAEKRVVFRSRWLPWALLAPQGLVIAVFFFWPAGQALVQSFQQSDAFGTSVEWVGLENFRNLFNDPTYLASFWTTAVFSVLVASIGIGLSLFLAVFADRVIKGSTAYRTLLIWPYAVAPAVAGVLWMFMFAPSVGIVSFPNFGHWSHLWAMMRGRMPVTREMPYQWYDTPNLHLTTIRDFDLFLKKLNLDIEERVFLKEGRRVRAMVSKRASQAIYRFRRR